MTHLLRLQTAWVEAVAAYDSDDPNTVEAEQETLDALVDYVEAHDLNYTKWDPRGPE
jgi:hypothetical protein